MSSFIVDDKTIFKIVTWIDRQTYRQDIKASEVKRVLEKYEYITVP